MTGRDDKLPSVLVLAQDGRTAPLRTLEGIVKMLLEREDVNPNIAGTDNCRTPLSNAAWWGYEGILKMLLDQNDVRINVQDHKNKTALSVALSERHDKIARMISERAAIKSDIADPGHESLPPPAGNEDEFMAETEPSDDHSNTSTRKPSLEPTSPPADPIRWMGVKRRRFCS